MALRIQIHPLIPSNFDAGGIGSVHAAEIKMIVNSCSNYSKTAKNLLFRGGLSLLRPELAVASRAKSLT